MYTQYSRGICFKESYLFKHKSAVAFLLLWCSQTLKKCPPIVQRTMKSIWFPDRPSVFCWTMRHTSVCAAAAPLLTLFSSASFWGAADSILVSNNRALISPLPPTTQPPFTCQTNLLGLLGVKDPIWNDKACPETADSQKRPGKSSSPQ